MTPDEKAITDQALAHALVTNRRFIMSVRWAIRPDTDPADVAQAIAIAYHALDPGQVLASVVGFAMVALKHPELYEFGGEFVDPVAGPAGDPVAGM